MPISGIEIGRQDIDVEGRKGLGVRLQRDVVYEWLALPGAYHGLALGAVVFILLWFAHLPLKLEAQAILAWSIVSVLLVIIGQIDRLEAEQARVLKWLRILATLLGGFVSLRYFSWRINYTISYHDPLSLVSAILLLGAELYGLIIYLIGLVTNAYPIERRPRPLPEDPAQLPTVDILIPTYNEDPEILEVTLLAATQIDYPKSRFKVYLCDDGGTVQRRNRPDISAQAWERHRTLITLCERVGAIYVTRERNEHAKAGNLNTALQNHCQGELVVILDADHVPTVDFLKNTVGFFLEDPKLFLVQTPHYFINPDPLERNLSFYEQMPSENEMFYSIIQHGLDFWNASFFCGSAAVLRRCYLDVVGGIAGETVTEDAETAMMLHGQHGLNSIYFGKPMIAGLQPETFSGFIVQRTRWMQGMVQIFLLKNPWRYSKMTIAQRLTYTASSAFWFFPYARLVFAFAPGMYLLLSLKIVDASLFQIAAYALPHVLGSMIVSNILYGRTRWPMISEVYEFIQSMHTFPALLNVLRNPRSPVFGITPKGEHLEENFISQLALPFYLMLIFNSACLIAGALRLYYLPEELGVILLTMALSVLNLIFSMAAVGVMLEKAQRRAAPREPVMLVDLDATLVAEDGCSYPIRIKNLSYSGAGVTAFVALPKLEEAILQVRVPVWHQQQVELPVRVVRHHYLNSRQWELGLQFQPKTLANKRAVVALVYGDSNLHETNRRHHQRRIGLLQGFGLVTWKAFHHCMLNFSFLTVHYARRLANALCEQSKSLRTLSSNLSLEEV